MKTRGERRLATERDKLELRRKTYQNELYEAYRKLMDLEEGRLVLMHLLTVSGMVEERAFSNSNNQTYFNLGLAERDRVLRLDLEDADIEKFFAMRLWYRDRLKFQEGRD